MSALTDRSVSRCIAANDDYPPILLKKQCVAAQQRALKRKPKAPHTGVGSSFAILRRFWAVAANVNSSFAPFGPLRRNLLSPMICFMWANSISTFRLARREATNASVLAMSRARSRAPSWIDLVTFRLGVLGQHLNFSSHPSQSDFAVR